MLGPAPFGCAGSMQEPHIQSRSLPLAPYTEYALKGDLFPVSAPRGESLIGVNP